jgi:DNA ligase-associated metallophosphoesterase
VHLGKDAAFRARAVPLPHGSTRSDLDRLSAALTETGADRLVILGDLFHAAAGMTDATLDALEAWRDRHAGVEVVLVRGNHDRSAGPAPERLHITERKAPVASAPFVYRHEPGSSAGGFVLCGHLHPVVRLDGRGGERLRLRCFYRRRDRLVLPAFGEFTGGHVVAPRTGEAAYAVADGEVVAVSP